jgi:hypothetical protein
MEISQDYDIHQKKKKKKVIDGRISYNKVVLLKYNSV